MIVVISTINLLYTHIACAIMFYGHSCMLHRNDVITTNHYYIIMMSWLYVSVAPGACVSVASGDEGGGGEEGRGEGWEGTV